MTRLVGVLGIGSPHGDDAVGWRLIERLQERCDLPAAVAAVTPMRLLDHIQPEGDLVIVDACAVELPPGTLVRCVWPDPRIAVGRHRSTHEFGVAETLRMAEALGRLSGRVVVFGVAIAAPIPGDTLTPAVAACLPELERLVVAEIYRLKSGTA